MLGTTKIEIDLVELEFLRDLVGTHGQEFADFLVLEDMENKSAGGLKTSMGREIRVKLNRAVEFVDKLQFNLATEASNWVAPEGEFMNSKYWEERE